MMNNNFEEAKGKAIKFIGISKKTTYEVKRKLSLLNFSYDIINDVIEYLISLNYLNDYDYVKSFIIQNIRMKKYSIFEIINKLKIKGIDVSIYSSLIEELYKNNYEKEVILKLEMTKLKNLDEIHKKKYLFRRGFENISFEN